MQVKTIILFCIILLLFTGSKPLKLKSELPDKGIYREIFGSRYEEALSFIDQHDRFDSIFRAENISPHFIFSLVFPELIRYSAIRDQLEIASLFTLYIQFGSGYANFSIGPFQIKPSFALQIERDYSQLNNAKMDAFDISDTPSARKERIKRLNSGDWQAIYLILFVRIMDEKYKTVKWDTEKARMVFYAKAYNCGYYKTRDEIETISKQNSFHINPFSDSEERYSYAQIAEEFYSTHPSTLQ
jgi:hypothetical protein